MPKHTHHRGDTGPQATSAVTAGAAGWARRAALLCALWACGCGAEDVPGQSHTIDASLWTSFAASVTESSTGLDPSSSADGAALTPAPQTDVWSVDAQGVAQYASTQMAGPEAPAAGRPQVVAVRKLDGSALVALQNALASSRVFAWDSVIDCDAVACTEDAGTAVLEVDLNGRRKTVVWPLYADGLPAGLEGMAQTIKDASSNS